MNDIECANCFAKLGVTDGFCDFAFCDEDCRAEYYEEQERERQ